MEGMICMRRQRKGFLTWIASLIPGAGELYMGFEKQGVSLMILFLGKRGTDCNAWHGLADFFTAGYMVLQFFPCA